MDVCMDGSPISVITYLGDTWMGNPYDTEEGYGIQSQIRRRVM